MGTSVSLWYRGVRWNGGTRRWEAWITHNGKRTCLGSFAARWEEDAARAYDRVTVWYALHRVARRGGVEALNFGRDCWIVLATSSNASCTLVS